MIKTKFTEMFGIEKPIVQGGMQHLGIAEFASLVCNAGGMGTINITCYPGVDEFHEDVIKMKEFTNNKPFIVNISLVPDLTKGEEIFKYIDVCAKEGVAAIEFAGASPVEFMPACKEAGIKIIHKSPNAKVAASMARKGADVITIAGYEVAGHPSMDGIGTFVIANKAAKVCAEYGVPVLAAGGVADGKGLAAALALGAQGVVLGTRFVATTECPISDNPQGMAVRAYRKRYSYYPEIHSQCSPCCKQHGSKADSGNGKERNHSGRTDDGYCRKTEQEML